MTSGSPSTERLNDDAGREDADIETSTEDYARRFAGPVGRWFLQVQERTTLALLRHLPPGATVLDVGGGHGQLTRALIRAGYRLTVVGSAPSCARRIAQWVEAGDCRFSVADLRRLPYADRTFDTVLCFRLLPHSVAWPRLVGELCRVARYSVVADYPSRRSVNLIAERLFALKHRIESNTRPFLVFAPCEVRECFATHGFDVTDERAQFLLPMALYRGLGSARVGRLAEAPARLLRLTRWLGSPIIVRADRRA